MGHDGGPESCWGQAGLSSASVFSQEEAGLPQGQVSVRVHSLCAVPVLYLVHGGFAVIVCFLLSELFFCI